MTVTVSPVIMAHPSRRRMVDQLLGWLDRPATVVWDERNDRWHTGRRAWLAADRSASHGLVLQDDAIPCRDLVAGVEKALTCSPPEPVDSPLCLYVGRVRPFRQLVQRLVEKATDSTSWLTMSQLHWGVGIVMPTEHIDDMIASCDEHAEIDNYDRRISRWCQDRKLPVWYPWPSLVEHRGVKENPSLVSGRSADRRAHRFLGADVSALDQRWDGKVVSLPALSAANPTNGGDPVRFVSEKHPSLNLSNKPGLHGVRFVDGVCDVDRPNAASILQSPYWQRRGIRLATDKDLQPLATGAVATEAPTPPAATPAGEVPPDGKSADVLAWVGDDQGRARQALVVEQQRDKPRTTLVAALEKLADHAGRRVTGAASATMPALTTAGSNKEGLADG